LWQCSNCRYQVSVTAGTVLHKTRTECCHGYKRLTRPGYDHQPRSQRARRLLGEDLDGADFCSTFVHRGLPE
jgi:hypothetical protein